MFRIATLSLLAIGLSASLAPAQYVIVQPRRAFYSSPAVVYSSPFVTYSSPVVTYPSPVITYSSPVITSEPVVAYSSPVVTSAPLVSYSYYPATTVYSAPVAVPGVVTTRSYVGYGIFRPRGVYTESYVWPR